MPLSGRTAKSGIVVLATIGLVVAAYHVWRAAPRVPPAAAPAAATPGSSGTGPFARWLRFEPDSVRGKGAVDELYIDAMLGHQVFRLPPRGLHPQLARQLLLDDDKLLLSSGRRLWTRELAHQPGMVGKFCYLPLHLLSATASST